ncbi:MAG: hypothetical protein K2W82_09435 [Candidatus Obscuribacterales bacterium]|nr:hypothetical protein [Candidatus Obscuribacterales bacterium]
MALLSEHIHLKRRYYRSINLERDLDSAEALEGYVVTPRGAHALERILSAIGLQRASRAWTLTGAYGTGKSSFAHFLLSLCGPSQSASRKTGKQILNSASAGGKSDLSKFASRIGVRGVVRAVATAQREPVAHTVLKALNRGVQEYWSEAPGRKPDVFYALQDQCKRLKANATIDSGVVLEFVEEVARVASTGVVIVLDELGKGLEFAALHQADGDLYLLQQLAEFKSPSPDSAIFVIGLLHQSFAEYGQGLSSAQRTEWSKIQGRFEDIPFTNSASEAIRLISQAIEYSNEKWLGTLTKSCAKSWQREIAGIVPEFSSNETMLAELMPLHPIAAVALPLLCNRFAQNDRSLFTFLTSDEPHSFTHFLENHEVSKDTLPMMKLDSLYDYFVDVVGSNIHSRPHLSRWVEIQGRITESIGLDPDELRLLKAIGILNLIASAGTLRASRNLVALSMCDAPDNEFEVQRWKNLIDSIAERRLITYRRQLDELRVWEGSDFNIEQSLQLIIQAERRSLSDLLNKSAPLGPVVPQRHNYQFGTFRYLEQRFVSEAKELEGLNTESSTADGLVLFWVGPERCKSAPDYTNDGKPIVLLNASNVSVVQNAVHELSALQRIRQESPELQTDGVARREIRQRTFIAKRHLDAVLSECFEFKNGTTAYVIGEKCSIKSHRHLVACLSDISDEVYGSTPRLHNELINRRELTSQGAKARRELIEALVLKHDVPELGLKGFGPEVSMYKSVLQKTGIHRPIRKSDRWEIGAPTDTGVQAVWDAIEHFCIESVEAPRTVSELYELLSKAPYGVKSGVIPVLFAAVLIARSDDVCIYKDGSFLPILGPEHFELLVKDPSRFAVKHFVTTGLRAQVFKEIEELVSRPDKQPGKSRNASLLSVVKPLVQFVKSLPAYTRRTRNLSAQAISVRDAIINAKQPDELLFVAIPEALGLSEIVPKDKENTGKARELRLGLLNALRELQLAHEEMISECQALLCEAFRINAPSLRQTLRMRGQTLSLNMPNGEFASFVSHIVDDDVDDRVWLTRLLMIIGDKPAESWSDEDLDLFKEGVGTFAKRFNNFESIQSNLQHAPGAGYEAKKITLTQSSGKEAQKILWIDAAKDQSVSRIVDEIIREKLQSNPELYDAVVSKLAERLLSAVGSESRSRRGEA